MWLLTEDVWENSWGVKDVAPTDIITLQGLILKGQRAMLKHESGQILELSRWPTHSLTKKQTWVENV